MLTLHRCLRRVWMTAVATILLIIAGSTAALAAVHGYRIEALETLGGLESHAVAINAGGEVAGAARTAGGARRAVRWTREGVIHDLGTLGGESEAAGINLRGQVAGFSFTATGTLRAFRWTEAEGMRDLGTLGGSYSRARGISDAGHVVGLAAIAGDQVRAFRWTERGGMQSLGTLGGVYSEASAVNALGQVAGSATTPRGFFRAFRWTEGLGMRDLGTLSPLPTAQSLAWGINALGQVAGMTDTRFGFYHAFRWTEGLGMQDLGTLGGLNSYALGINAAGDVVGWSATRGAFDGSERAFLYTDEQGMVNLDARIDPALGWRLLVAHSINDAGQIAGYGLHNGQVRAFRLTPVPDTLPPVTAAALSPAPRASGWSNRAVTVTLTATDNPDGSQVREITYRAEGAQEIAPTTAAGAATSFPIPAEGRTTVTFFARDHAGNVEAAQTITVRIDMTPPMVAYTGHDDYSVDETVRLTCAVSDEGSGIVGRSCAEAVGPAYAFGPGTHTLTAVAADRAGNSTIASTRFTVRVTYESLCGLTERFVSRQEVAVALCALLQDASAAGDPRRRATARTAYIRAVADQSGQALSTEEAEILTRLAGALPD